MRVPAMFDPTGQDTARKRQAGSQPRLFVTPGRTRFPDKAGGMARPVTADMPEEDSGLDILYDRHLPLWKRPCST